jgi:hypothetical protein
MIGCKSTGATIPADAMTPIKIEYFWIAFQNLGVLDNQRSCIFFIFGFVFLLIFLLIE